MPPAQIKRGIGYSQVELESLLDYLEEHLPISGIEWERVDTAHKAKFPTEVRSLESLKCKFQDLYQTKIPTGDPFIPLEVRRAKMIQRMMEEWSSASDCEGNDKGNILPKSSDGQPDVDTNSLTSVESPAAVSQSTVRPLVKVSLFLSSRKQKGEEEMEKRCLGNHQTSDAPTRRRQRKDICMTGKKQRYVLRKKGVGVGVGTSVRLGCLNYIAALYSSISLAKGICTTASG